MRKLDNQNPAACGGSIKVELPRLIKAKYGTPPSAFDRERDQILAWLYWCLDGGCSRKRGMAIRAYKLHGYLQSAISYGSDRNKQAMWDEWQSLRKRIGQYFSTGPVGGGPGGIATQGGSQNTGLTFSATPMTGGTY